MFKMPLRLSFDNRARVAVFFLLFASVLCAHTVLPVHATPALKEGTSGSCKWEYKKEGNDTVLCIRPTNGTSGVLSKWDTVPPWRAQGLEKYYQETKRIVVEKSVQATTCLSMFEGFIKVKNIEISGLSTSGVENMSLMFSKCLALDGLNVKALDTSAVKKMKGVFNECRALTLLDLSEWDTSCVTDMSSLFQNCFALTFVGNLSRWDTRNVTQMQEMFNQCRSLKSLNIASWGTGQVRSMRIMFQDCQELVALDLSNWNTSQLTTMEGMFCNCYNLAMLDLSNWSGCHIDMRGAFRKTSLLRDLYIGYDFCLRHDARLVEAGTAVGNKWARIRGNEFVNINTVFALDGAEHLVDYHNHNRERFVRHYMRITHPPRNPEVAKGFYGGCTWEYQPNVKWGPDAGKTYTLRIYPLSGKDRGTLDNWEKDNGSVPPWRQPAYRNYFLNTTRVVVEKGETVAEPVKARTCAGMFEGFQNLQTVNLAGLDTGTAKNMQSMFEGCRALRSLDIGMKSVESIENMSYMFFGCSKLTTLNLKTWRTYSLTNASQMFNGCCALVRLDFSSWDTSKVVDMSGIFRDMPLLRDLTMGHTFSFGRDTGLGDTDTGAGAQWIQLKGGTVGNPLGERFSSVQELIEFHNAKRGYNPERYIKKSTAKGVSGDCMWEYVSNGSDADGKTTYKLSIHPLSGKDSGTLENWEGENPPWRHSACDNYRTQTTELEIKKGRVDKPVKARTCANMFKEFTKLKTVDVSGLDTSNVTNMDWMFATCSALTELDVKGLEVSKVTTMHGLFNLCRNLKTLSGIGDWNVSKVQNMRWLFGSCNKLNLGQDNLKKWRPSGVTDMVQTFGNCYALTSLDLSGWNVSRANMWGLFYDCKSLELLNLSGWNVSSEVITGSMFHGTTSLKNLTLGHNFDISDNADFEHAGSQVGSYWVQVGSGSVTNPKGEVFRDARKLRDFHNAKSGTGFECYVRYTTIKGVSGDCMWEYVPNGSDADGKMTYKLSIHPLSGKDSGTLENWGEENPPWRHSACDNYRTQTTELEIKKGTVDKPVKARTCANMFKEFTKLKTVDVSGLDTSNVTNMDWMFATCSALTELDVKGFEVSKVTTMHGLFNLCRNLETLSGIGDWNVSKVQNMRWLFGSCNKLDLGQDNLKKWRPSGVTDMVQTFGNCYALTSLDLSGWNVSNVNTMWGLFCDCKSLELLNLSGWNVSSKVETGSMFYGTTSLKNLTLGHNFNIGGKADFEHAGSQVGDYWVQVGSGSVTNPKGEVFRDAGKLRDFHNAKSGTGFECYVRYAASKGISGDCMWEYVPNGSDADGKTTYKLSIHPLSGKDSGTLENWGEENPPWRHSACDNYRTQTTELEIKKGTVDKPVKARTCANMFKEFTKLKTVDVSGLDTSNVTNMDWMFATCSALTELDVKGFEVSKVTTMHGLFNLCRNLETLSGIGDWNVSKVQNMRWLFGSCNKLNLGQDNLKKWRPSGVTDMVQTFGNCYALTSLDLSGWNVSRANMWGLFYDCKSLELLNLSGWNVSSEVITGSMFHGTTSLKNLTLGHNFDISDNADFEHVGSQVGDYWVQVGTGSATNPRGKVFRDAGKLRDFHNAKSGTGFECYVRYTASKGISGDCMWEYVSLNKKDLEGKETYKLSIHPLSGKDSGTLEDWGEENPPWKHSLYDNYRTQTTVLEIKKGTVDKPVKARTCANMFKEFTKLKTVDVSGLDTSNVTNMDWMFDTCSILTELDVKGLEVSKVTTMRGLFNQCRSLKTLSGIGDWNVSKVQNMRWLFGSCYKLDLGQDNLKKWHPSGVTDMVQTFGNCYALTSLDLSGWNVSRANMWGLFYDCDSLELLNLSGWNVSGEVETGKMFHGTRSLKNLRLGHNFDIGDKADFEDAGTRVGTHWMQVDTRNRGTKDDPRGTAFASAQELIAFHKGASERNTISEWYVRVASTLTIEFDKGADDAQGTMNPQVFAFNEEKALSGNAYQRDGYQFDGWKDAEGTKYKDKASFKNTTPGRNIRKVLTAVWKEDMSGKAFFTYRVNDSKMASVLRQSEIIPATDGKDIQGSLAFSRDPEKYVFTKWTCDVDSTWSYTKALLQKGQIDAVAKKGGRYVSATFTAHFEVKTLTIMFEGIEKSLRVPYGESVLIPLDYVPFLAAGERFDGWNTKADGTGTTYQPGDTIANVTESMTLYFKGQRAKASLIYKVDDPKKGALLRSREDIDATSGSPEGSFAYSFNSEKYVFVKWTCSTDANWSHDNAQLKKEAIDKVAKKDGRYVSVTFTAHFELKTFKITFDSTEYVLTVEPGKSIQIPQDYVSTAEELKEFDGWSTEPDCGGTKYLPGETIADVSEDMTLHPCWKEIMVTFTYTVNNPAMGEVSERTESVLLSDTNNNGIDGAFAYPTNTGRYEFVKWTCDTNPAWFHSKRRLKKEEVRKAATKDGKLVSTIFTAHFRSKRASSRG